MGLKAEYSTVKGGYILNGPEILAVEEKIIEKENT